MEEAICANYGIPFRGISTGKFRRYFSFQNFFDVLKIPFGFFQALNILWRFSPDIVWSKGGYVSFPVVFAAWMLRCKIVIHESDSIPGMTTTISSHFADKICVAWEETQKYFSPKKTVLTGIPLRKVILEADPQKGRDILGLHEKIPVLLIVGGSTGAQKLNELIIQALPKLLSRCFVVHFFGKGKAPSKQTLDELFQTKNLDTFKKRYHVAEYLDEPYAHILALSDLVVSRAGANALFEFVALKKPNILLPLGLSASRGDQIENAKIMARKGCSIIFDENSVTSDILAQTILDLLRDTRKLASFRAALEQSSFLYDPLIIAKILLRNF